MRLLFFMNIIYLSELHFCVRTTLKQVLDMESSQRALAQDLMSPESQVQCGSPADATWFGAVKGSKNLCRCHLKVTLPKYWLEFQVALQNVFCMILDS